jgi:hypothetical protein
MDAPERTGLKIDGERAAAVRPGNAVFLSTVGEISCHNKFSGTPRALRAGPNTSRRRFNTAAVVTRMKQAFHNMEP